MYDWFDKIISVQYNPKSVHGTLSVIFFGAYVIFSSEKLEKRVTVRDFHLLHSIVFANRDSIAQLLDSNEADKAGWWRFFALPSIPQEF